MRREEAVRAVRSSRKSAIDAETDVANLDASSRFADQADLRDLSTRSEQRIIEGVTHVSLTLEHPEVIVTAVRDVLAAIENASEARRTHS
jgi:hypothetical protein